MLHFLQIICMYFDEKIGDKQPSLDLRTEGNCIKGSSDILYESLYVCVSNVWLVCVCRFDDGGNPSSATDGITAVEW